MFKKILIANRGEIACRIMRTARTLGVATVAVYSEADASSAHVAMADEAILIGGAAVADSYLRGDRVIEAALNTGAEAVHPGYGFLSENPEFVDQVVAAGLRFIGPSADAIRAMGLKDAAKTLMEKAGVPVVPGYHGDNRDPEFLASVAERIGFPVLIKARAGGGGKGMRLVQAKEEFAAALAGAQREAESSFGDSACLIEKFVSAPRHIEVQVFGDDHGNVVHLFERDCSLQRRHQKVIEEAPAPGMTDEMRAAMGEAAVTACHAINYSGAGTIEFIVDSSDGLKTDAFWFMEMNTRLQVEHPVTEAITGQDLVAWQLQVASGARLPVTQSDLSINGWAFEARLYAEDVGKGFLPATGVLSYLEFPAGARVDTGIRQGDAITPFYDPMIAKIIVHGSDRSAALGKLHRALRETYSAGSITNVNFLSALCEDHNFASGTVDTGLIERHAERLTQSVSASTEILAIAAIAASGLFAANASDTGFSLWQPLERTVLLRPEGTDESIEMRLATVDAMSFAVTGCGVSHQIRLLDPLNGKVEIDATQQSVYAVNKARNVSVFSDRSYHFSVSDPLQQQADEGAGGDSVYAPMPGQVNVVNVARGDRVSVGEALIVIEAMKMEHTLLAPRDGVIEELLARTGMQVEEGALLLSLEAEAEEAQTRS
ncbi:3-methylcrotonyl-CoA carboxylase [Chromatiales bacterium (ex Bugula neritina AB1)]|nr:3-methylcrotonyl-CoA carboxylase [Chromatiales bacterium (ex Bugula neritina AB1)]